MKSLTLVLLILISIDCKAQWPGAYYGFELEGPDGKIVHVVDPTEVADVVAWLEELGHHTIRLARSAEESEALLDEWQAGTEETAASH